MIQWVSKLTAKQEKYVQGLVAGLSQREAYRKAYPNSVKWKDSAVDSNASTLFKNAKVLQSYNKLMGEHKRKALWTREESVNKLKWLIDKSIDSIDSIDEGYVRQGTSGALMSAIQELNKLEGVYPDDQLKRKKLEVEIESKQKELESEQSINDFKITIVDEWSDKDDI